MRTLQELQSLVAEWSRDNFGDQSSKASFIDCLFDHGHRPTATGKGDYGIPLGSLAPLLGIGEEIGELANAKDRDELKDAYADILIYACDFGAREGVVFDEAFLKPTPTASGGVMALLHYRYGCLCHVVLKRHQGIRGFDDEDFYVEKRNEALNGFLCQLSFNCGVLLGGENTLLTIANETFDKIVSKRNWKSKSVDQTSSI